MPSSIFLMTAVIISKGKIPRRWSSRSAWLKNPGTRTPGLAKCPIMLVAGRAKTTRGSVQQPPGFFHRQIPLSDLNSKLAQFFEEVGKLGVHRGFGIFFGGGFCGWRCRGSLFI